MDEKVIFKSGASRSEYKPAYHHIPASALRRLAQRYALGIEKHGEHNWLRGGTDRHYLSQVFNHIIDHLLLYRDGVNNDDDHLGAAMWGIAALCEYEARGHCRPGLIGLPTEQEVADAKKKETQESDRRNTRHDSDQNEMDQNL